MASEDRPAGRQLALALEQRPAHGREDFLVADSNRDALAWVEAWPGWPARCLVVAGPAGSGKTHLAQVWRARSGARMLDARRLDPAGDDAGTAVIESVDAAVDDEALLHTLNRIVEAGGYVLATAREPPGQWRGRLPDLVTRLRAAPTVEIGRPDDALIAAVLVKLFADRQLAVGEEVVEYLVGHMERTFEAAQRVVAAIDALALAERRRVTVPLVRRVLGEAGEPG